MNFNPPSPTQEFLFIKDDGDDVAAPVQRGKDQAQDDSSDDAPLMMRRRLRENVDEQDTGTASHPRRSLRETTRSHQRDSAVHTRDRPVIRQATKTSPKQASTHKKPGPRAWAAKPIMKNDMKAKMEIIREIESFWGRGFIKSYIPRCHRPLLKRNGGSKRSVYRQHENNPKNWLPSVLKAILMIAKLTDDKQWLKKAMNDVVRYRIKHTGNRKPQLVTTDFDVIEDMLVKDWSVLYSFEIRYKHLLVNRKDQEEDDEVIDQILMASSDREDDANDQEEDDESRDLCDQNEDVDVEEQQGTGCGRSDYTKASRYESPAPPRKKQKQAKARKDTPSNQTQIKQEHMQQQYPGMFGFGGQVPGYGPPMNPWGVPMPGYGGAGAFNNSFGGYGGYGGYAGYGGYDPPQHGQNLRQGTQPLLPHGMPMYPSPHAMTPAPSLPDSEYSAHCGNPNKRGRTSPPMRSAGSQHAFGPPSGFDMQGYPDPYNGGRNTIKLESPEDEHRSLSNDIERTMNDAGAPDDHLDNGDALDAEVEAMELELKLAKLKATRLRERETRKNM
jgi:hypothetical protein